MLYFDRIDAFEGIDVDKTSASEEHDISYYEYFLNEGCNRCHNLSMVSMDINDIATSNIKGSGYRSIISLISKNEAINLIQNASLTEKA